jgi:AraC-like DNA-binding protein
MHFIVGFRHHLSPGRACGLHAHRDCELVYHPTGSGTTGGDAGTLTFAPGELVIYPAKTAHDQSMDEAGEDWCLHARGVDLPAPLAGSIWSAPVGDDAVTVAELAWLTSGVAQAGALADQRLAAVLTTALTRARVARTSTAADPARALVERARRLARERGHLLAGVAELARELDVSPDWLRHACARAGGETPLQLLTAARLTRARALLEHTPQPLAEVARQSGYRDARYLVAVFRRELGCTPGQLRAGRQAVQRRPSRKPRS